MKLMRYMDVKKYRDLLSTKTLFLPRYDNLGDMFEGSLGYVPAGKLIEQRTERLKRITQMPQQGNTIAREFLEAFEPLFYHKFLRNFTFVSCWHQSEKESALMWKMYAQKGVMIKSDLSSLKSSLGINANGYQRSNIFWQDHGIDNVNGYEISVEVNKVKYLPHGTEIEAVGSDRYFHKQAEYEDEKELRIVLQLELGPQQRANFPFEIDNSPLTHNEEEMHNLILRSWKSVERSHEKHSLVLNDILSEPGVRCRVDINSLIKEVIVNPFDSGDSDVSEIESLNREFGLAAKVKKSVIETRKSPTTFSIKISEGKTINFVL
ncbi:hypothetical protein F4054_05440 [Candidatus Poribacteria bacterium]|nr:hypothetical protein [Candidatus Poribacteria bacterium]MYG07236.1 hypothetical protein [Candidatus Poribacteria bacterium]MYK21689.1 hypothetical protein [Candidatus Poribacteria bacterium]